MNKRALVASVLSLGLVTTPIAAVAQDRASQPVAGKSKLGGDGALVPILYGLGLLVAAFVISESMDNDDDDVAVSP